MARILLYGRGGAFKQMTKTCPRCKQARAAIAFEPPVSICLVCYGSLPGHYDLSVEQLRQKARRSRKGRRRNERRDLLSQFMDPDETIAPGHLIECRKCSEPRPISAFAEGDICDRCQINEDEADGTA